MSITISDYIQRHQVRTLPAKLQQLKIMLQKLKDYNRLIKSAARGMRYCSNTGELAALAESYRRALAYRNMQLHEIINR